MAIVADYVVVGAGAAGMAFVDTMLDESDATFVMVDRRAKPGGHWNDAYPFVRLHTPASIYGVNSTPLGDGSLDKLGGNLGLGELSSGSEIVGYFDRVMERRFLVSGRVTYLSKHDYCDGVATSLLTGRQTHLQARRRMVDATYSDTRVPATHPPGFPVAAEASLVTPNGLAEQDRPAEGYVLIGGGKTSIDCALWLLDQGVEPDAIRWIRPRESWLYNRRFLQPDPNLAAGSIGIYADMMEAAAGASTLPELFARLEACRALLRIDTGVEPMMFHCATVSEAEVEQLRRITQVIRQGRVRALEADRILLDRGEVQTSPGDVHVHCAASGIPVRPAQPIFSADGILLQFVEHCRPILSAAMIAFLEARRNNDVERNRLAEPIPMADKPSDWLKCQLGDARNHAAWETEADITDWIAHARVHGFAAMYAAAMCDPDSHAHTELQRVHRFAPEGMARIATLQAEIANVGPQ